MSKKTDSETVELATATPDAPHEVAADPASPIPGTVEQTLEPALASYVNLRGRLTHDGETYNPGETVRLPANLAHGLLQAGRLIKSE